MSRDQHRRSLVVDVAQKAQQLRSEVCVEVSRRFVGEDQAWLVCEGARDSYSLLFTTRQRIGHRRLSVLETEPVENLDRATLGLARRNPMNAQHKGDVLEDVFSSQKLEILEDHTDLSPQKRKL